ncbi:microcephalin isoform X2 [Clupea harengus]|uniref:Microcephalin isoform X2 n=1 Tax=Clupea harengus TaxID=7950 RepID=A0A6P8G448_CLUHA|nr:microcephalin isoform X2 [Clupea harengus]
MTKKQSSTILKDVVAFVDVWSTSKRENYSDGFMQQLIEMGAEVSRTFNKNVTHVIFKHGHQSTWKKAQKMGVKIVTVLWVDRCRSEGKHVDENLCPAVNEDSKSVLVNKRTHKCMQPRDIPLRTPENDRRLKKRLDKMMLNLTPSSPIVSDLSPLIIDEEHGIVYSPSSRRAETMALRLQQMKERRENLSPTASQMVDSTFTHEHSQKPSFGSSPSTSFLPLLEEDDSTSHHGHTPDVEAAQGSHYTSASKSDSSGPTITPSEEKNHHRKTWKLSASTPLSGDAPKRRSSGERVASVTDSKAALPPKRKGLSKTAAKRSTANQNSLDSYFSTAVPKGKRTVMVDDNVYSDVESRLKLTPPKDGTLIEDTQINTSPTFNETRTKTNKLGSSHIQTCTSPILSMSTECERKNSTLVSVSSLPKACSLKKESLTAVSQLKKVTKSSFSPSPNGEDDVFEDYFSSTEKPTRKKTLALDISPEKDPYSLFEPSAQPAKRKRRKSESVESGKRRKQAPVSAAAFFAEPAGLSSPEDVASLIPKPRSYGRCKSAQKQPASSGKDKKPGAVTDGSERAGDKDDARHEQLTLTFPKPPLTSRLNEARSRKVSQTLSEGIKYAPDGLRDTSTEMFSCQGGEKDKNVKTKRTLVMTSMPTENQHTVLQLVQTLGGFSVVDKVCESTSHVVAGSPRRTLNVLLGIARGCWILSYEWVLWCLEHRQWIPEEPYELSDDFPAAPRCHLVLCRGAQTHVEGGKCAVGTASRTFH